MANSEHQPYQPTQAEVIGHLEVIEAAMGPLVDTHLRWVEKGESPTSDITPRDYGYVPERFTASAQRLDTPRPTREPIDARGVMTKVLGLDYDTEFWEIAKRVREVDDGWYDFLNREGFMSQDHVEAMRAASETAYVEGALTEDNLPTYTSTILGGFQALAERHGLRMPAAFEWSRGIWSADEFKHLITMNYYGEIRGITSSKKHRLGQNSQVRAGMEITFAHPISLNGYVGWQEPSTFVSHSNTGVLLGPVGAELLSDIAANEMQHSFFYTGVMAELVKQFPDHVVRTLYDLFVLQDPFMPGSKAIPNFVRHAVSIANAGIFDYEQSFTTMRQYLTRIGILGSGDLAGLSSAGQVALAGLKEKYDRDFVKPEGKTKRFTLGQTTTRRELGEQRKAYVASLGLPDLAALARATRLRRS